MHLAAANRVDNIDYTRPKLDPKPPAPPPQESEEEEDESEEQERE